MKTTGIRLLLHVRSCSVGPRSAWLHPWTSPSSLSTRTWWDPGCSTGRHLPGCSRLDQPFCSTEVQASVEMLQVPALHLSQVCCSRRAARWYPAQGQVPSHTHSLRRTWQRATGAFKPPRGLSSFCSNALSRVTSSDGPAWERHREKHPQHHQHFPRAASPWQHRQQCWCFLQPSLHCSLAVLQLCLVPSTPICRAAARDGHAPACTETPLWLTLSSLLILPWAELNTT